MNILDNIFIELIPVVTYVDQEIAEDCKPIFKKFLWITYQDGFTQIKYNNVVRVLDRQSIFVRPSDIRSMFETKALDAEKTTITQLTFTDGHYITVRDTVEQMKLKLNAGIVGQVAKQHYRNIE